MMTCVAVPGWNGGQIAQELEDFPFIFVGESREALGIDNACGSHEVAWKEPTPGSGTGLRGGIPGKDLAH